MIFLYNFDQLIKQMLVLLIVSLLFPLIYADSSWMKEVSGKKYLSELSLPGTHNTCALYGGIYAKCQTLTLTEQLNLGVRLFDIRCRHIRNDFHLYHGIMDQKVSYQEVQKECLEFLKKNPSECIVLSIKKEGDSIKNTRSFGETFKKIIKGKPYYQKKTIPKLGDVRGRLVIVSRNHEVRGIPWSSLKIQDAYKVSGNKDIEKKWKLVKNHFHMVESDKTKAWKVNFVSGNGFWSPPSIIAESLNPRVQVFLEKSKAKSFGTVLMDFPSKDLIRVVFERNKKMKK